MDQPSFIVKPYNEPEPATIWQRFMRLVLSGGMWGIFWWLIFTRLIG